MESEDLFVETPPIGSQPATKDPDETQMTGQSNGTEHASDKSAAPGDDDDDDDATQMADEMAEDEPADEDLADFDFDDEDAAEMPDENNANPRAESRANGKSPTAANKSSSEVRPTALPMNRIKTLMKLDPDFGLAKSEAVFLMCKATELFIDSLTKESFVYTAQARKKTVQRKDIDKAIESVDALMFLEGALV